MSIFYTFRNCIRHAMPLSQLEIHNRNEARLNDLRQSIIKILKSEMNSDPNLTFRSIELQLESFIKFPGLNYFANSSLTTALEKESVSKDLKDIFKGNKAELETFFTSLDLNTTIKPICDAALCNAKSGFMNLIQNNLENGVELSSLTKTLERAFLRVKIDRYKADTDIVSYDEYRDEYDLKLCSQILNSHIFLKSVIVQNLEKDSSFRDFLFSLLKSHFSCMIDPATKLKNLTDENLVQVLGILQKFGDKFKVTNLYQLNALSFIEDDSQKVKEILSQAITKTSIDQVIQDIEIPAEKLASRFNSGKELDEPNLAFLIKNASFKTLKTLAKDFLPDCCSIQIYFHDDFHCGESDLKDPGTRDKVDQQFINAIINKWNILHWNDLSPEKKSNILKGLEKSSERQDETFEKMTFHVLLDKKNIELCRTFLHQLTDEQLLCLYNKRNCFHYPTQNYFHIGLSTLFACTSNRQKLLIFEYHLKNYRKITIDFENSASIEMLKSMSDDEKSIFLSCIYQHLNVEYYPNEIIYAIFNTMAVDKQFSFIAKYPYHQGIQKIISTKNAEWQCDFFRYLNESEKLNSINYFFEHFSLEAKRSIWLHFSPELLNMRIKS